MRALFFALTVIVSAPTYALEHKATNGDTYYPITYPIIDGVTLTAGVPCCTETIEYTQLIPPKTVKYDDIGASDYRHYQFTNNINSTALYLHSSDSIVKAEYLTISSIYISGDGPTLHLDSIRAGSLWKKLTIAKNGTHVSLEGLGDSSLQLPTTNTEHIVAATRKVLAKELNNNAEFWLSLAKNCSVENDTITGSCNFYVRQAVIKLTFKHVEPIMFTIDYIVGC